MALVLANRVQETTTTTGTGTITLAGAVSGFQSFAAIGNGNTTYYTITSGTAWEVGIGTYTSAGTTLSRDTVLSSSAGGVTKITLAGISTVFSDYPAEKAISNGYGTLPVANGGTGATSLTSGYLVKGNGTSAVSASVVYDDGTNVGIGTSSPASLGTLVVSKASSGTPIIALESQGSWSASISANSSGNLIFSNNATTERMRIASDGTTTLSIGGVSSTHQFNYNESGGEIQLIDSTGAGPILIDNVSGLARFYKVGTGAISMGTTGANYFQFITNGSERMRIDSSGNVGIGTSSPSSKLDVNGKVSLTGGEDQQLQWTNNGQTWRVNNSTTGRWYLLDSTGSKYPFGVAAGTSNDTLCLTSTGVGIGTQTPGAALQINRASGAADLRFSVAGTLYSNMYASSSDVNIFAVTAIPLILGTNNTERMRIDASGNVGIGNSGPGYRLDVSAADTTSGLGYAARLRSNATATAAALQFTNSAVSAENGLIACTDAGLITVQGSSAMAFRTNGNERFRILSTGGITSSDLADAVGYKGLPQNSQTASYTLALTDMGKHISITTGGVVIPANGSVAFPIGSAVSIFNNSGSSQTISITTDTLRLAGTATTGSRTLAQYGVATCLKVTSTVWVISGAGVT